MDELKEYINTFSKVFIVIITLYFLLSLCFAVCPSLSTHACTDRSYSPLGFIWHVFFFSVEFKVSIILIRFEVSGSNDYSNRFLLQWTWNSCMKVIEGYFILSIFPSFLSTNRMCPWHQHEFLLYTDGPTAEFVKSGRFTSCFILSSLHANSLVMKKTRRHRIFLKTENPCRPFSHDAYDCCRPLNGFIDGLKDEYSIYMSHY